MLFLYEFYCYSFLKWRNRFWNTCYIVYSVTIFQGHFLLKSVYWIDLRTFDQNSIISCYPVFCFGTIFLLQGQSVSLVTDVENNCFINFFRKKLDSYNRQLLISLVTFCYNFIVRSFKWGLRPQTVAFTTLAEIAHVKNVQSWNILAYEILISLMKSERKSHAK